jgi:hypothetical protein
MAASFATCRVGLFVEAIELDVQAITEAAAMTLAAGQEGSGLVGGLGVDAPLFKPSDLHSGVERFQSSFLCGYGHGILTNHH